MEFDKRNHLFAPGLSPGWLVHHLGGGVERDGVVAQPPHHNARRVRIPPRNVDQHMVLRVRGRLHFQHARREERAGQERFAPVTSMRPRGFSTPYWQARIICRCERGQIAPVGEIPERAELEGAERAA